MTKARLCREETNGVFVWDNAGVSAVRNEENAYNISPISIQVTENKESVRNLPALESVCSGET